MSITTRYVVDLDYSIAVKDKWEKEGSTNDPRRKASLAPSQWVGYSTAPWRSRLPSFGAEEWNQTTSCVG